MSMTSTKQIDTMKDLLEELNRFRVRLTRYQNDPDKDDIYPYPSRTRAAARRSSMDLTHALAAWRKDGCPRKKVA